MTIGEIIKRYRIEHGLSQRDFAKICGELSDGNVSNGYISMVEQGRNPSTKKPIVPSIDKLALFARAMNMTLQQLIDSAEDMPVFVGDTEKYDANLEKEIAQGQAPRKWRLLSAGALTLTDEQLDKIYAVCHVMHPEKFPLDEDERND